MIAEAHALADFGFSVFPIEPGGKRPCGRLVRNGLHQATTDLAVVRGWWSVEREANIGVRTGKGLVVLDEDGDDGADSRAGLEREHSGLPETVRAVTPRGTHYFFTVAGTVPCSAGRVAPGLDIRGDGGYVVVPPSLHPSRQRYEWDVAPGEAPIAPLPEWLAGLVAPSSRPTGPQPTSRWLELLRGVHEGHRNDAAARLCGHLLAKGVDPLVALELIVAWDGQRNQPSLGRDEITRVCESIACRELRKRGARVSA